MNTPINHTPAIPLRLRDDYHRLQIALIGCGGNGSHMAEAIARVASLLRRQGRPVDLTFLDPDDVEPENIPRQNFSEAEVGLNKARLLALRYSAKWGVPIQAIPNTFQSQHLNYYNTLTLLVGCVDNPAGRATISEVLGQNERSPRVWWLDLGNGEETGQVILGSAKHLESLKYAFVLSSVCTATPSAGWLHPELIDTKPTPPPATAKKGQGCAQLALTNAQMPAVNQMTAAIGAAMLTKLLVTGDLQYWASYFDLSTGKQVSYATTPQVIEDVLTRLQPPQTQKQR